MAALPNDPNRPAGRSFLGPDLVITGELTAAGTLEISGQVDGKIAAQSVILGHDGKIKGAVTAESLDVRGRLDGKISCRTLTLRAAAQVKTHANYSTLVIESGAQVEGRFSRPKG